ncbi:MAG: helix-turn-helix transcriptional regulator [bacterium]|nr:helix-turn-helix transcriptional regulator [bacterium]
MSFYEQQKKMKEQMAHDVIYDAAMKIISESGYEGLTMQKVAQCAGIATGTLYNYFENKKRIFLYIHKRVHDTLLKKLLEVSQQDKDPVVLLEEFLRK